MQANTEPQSIEKNYAANIGILFCDIDEPVSLKSITTFRTPVFSSIPLHSINIVTTNPNKINCQYYALGYNSGFVRVRKLMKRRQLEPGRC